VEDEPVTLPGANVPLPLHAPGYSTHLWGAVWRGVSEPLHADVVERFLTLSGAILQRVDDPEVHRLGAQFLRLLLPRVVDIRIGSMTRRAADLRDAALRETFGKYRDEIPANPVPDDMGTWGARLTHGRPSSPIAGKLEDDAAFGVACAHADGELGLSAPGEIDPAMCLLWELYPEFASTPDPDAWVRHFARYIAGAAYFWCRRGNAGVDDIAEVLAADCAEFYWSIGVSSIHMVAHVIARLREDVIPRSDPRIEALYGRHDRARQRSMKRSWIRRRLDP
jgi:hypothetical protein